jgi:hypothetical protein
MNERIEKLARQAGALPTQDCGVPQWYIDEDEFEKFAELIVAECVKVAMKAVSDDEPKEAWYLIKEHFGVE